jgi:hypothetical protein
MLNSTSQPVPNAAPDPFAVHAEERRVMAREAAEIILAVMRATGRQAIEFQEPSQPADAPQPTEPDAAPVEAAAAPRRAAPRVDPAERLDRLARSLRLTLTLEAKFEEALRAYLAGEVAKCEAARAKAEADADDPACVVSPFKRVRQGRHGEVRERVVDVIDREIPDPDEHEILGDALDERLLWDPAYADLDDKPLRDIVEHLCADLKLKPDWKRWAGDGWKPNPPFFRPLCSPFHTRSAVPILDDDDPDTLE